jgi:hypothetical protein
VATGSVEAQIDNGRGEDPTPTGFTVKINRRRTLFPEASFSRTPNENFPEALVMPLMRPLELCSWNPVGKVPAESFHW